MSLNNIDILNIFPRFIKYSLLIYNIYLSPFLVNFSTATDLARVPIYNNFLGFDCASRTASTNFFGLPASTNQPIPSSRTTNSASDPCPVIAIIGFPTDIILYSRLGTPAPVMLGNNVINAMA